ncbi:RNA methyltransferase [Candidimonas sp. SYP-B2681]|uniref:TrmH family RNA methyltransferase n=1 Tax=Candidimonas sp. SYP-B2681 TaxID=2497686 RepID=UPI000F87BD40|nr:RNA methyltransferase [Candidimonas sp. SYP-B2681]RTZ47954.1 RNA methyltransferase [Candidimonas sp. SYP-B2681]
MKHISSRDNPVYKRVLRLASGKREIGEGSAHGEHHIVLEGIHLCQAWLEHIGPPEQALFDAGRLEVNAELNALAQNIDSRLCLACEPRLMKALSQVEHGQGVCFVVAAPIPELPARIDNTCLWLDRIQDPGNVGTLLRTAAAAGINQAYLSAGCASAWSAKVLRSAQGAHFVMTIHEHTDLLALHKRLAIPLVATALESAHSLHQTSLPRACAWVLGNEGQGVDPALLTLAEKRVFVPQAPGVESLNVAVAAGICLFEQRRQHPH